MFRKLGPGILVTAAFVGPGTLTTATRAGAQFGLSLLWAVVFATVATILLQEMAARLGLVTRMGLGEAVRATFVHPGVRLAAALLIAVSIGLGNAAYQTGNLMGAALGLETLLGGLPGLAGVAGSGKGVEVLVLAAVAFFLLDSGKYRLVERVLIGLVLVMSVLFLVTALLVCPAPAEMLRGTLVPTLPAGSLSTVLALIGTTVVPYNLFLHASSVREKWKADEPVAESLRQARWDTVLSISLGGLITAALVATAAASFSAGASLQNAGDMARQLEHLLGGPAARICFAVGLFAAGLTSAITAPLAAAYAVGGVMGWDASLRSWKMRLVWLGVLLTGTVLALSLQKSPTETILLAQVANGLLLPCIAIFLLVAVNQTRLMGSYRNGRLGNLLGIAVVVLASGLGIYKVLRELGLGPW